MQGNLQHHKCSSIEVKFLVSHQLEFSVFNTILSVVLRNKALSKLYRDTYSLANNKYLAVSMELFLLITQHIPGMQVSVGGIRYLVGA